ncbi:MAG: hypothetical protein WHT06_15175 [Desulfobacterales bacterium]
MLDLSIAYHRYRFLGDEFLTWLWHGIETRAADLCALAPEINAIEIADRMVIENRTGQSKEKITIKGDHAGLEEAKLALRKGAWVSEMALLLRTAEDEYRLTIRGENLNLSGMKIPSAAGGTSPEELETAFLERLDHLIKITDFIDKIFYFYLSERISAKWKSLYLPSMRKWLVEDDEKKGAL